MHAPGGRVQSICFAVGGPARDRRMMNAPVIASFSADSDAPPVSESWRPLPAARPEERRLAWLCSVGLRRSAVPAPASSETVDWQRLGTIARRHRVMPLIWRNLRARPDMEMPAEIAGQFREAARQNAANALRLTSHLVRIVSTLTAAGIRVLPLKGIALAARYYPDVAARHAGDIDLLVAPENMDRADVILRGMGYHRVTNTTHVWAQAPFTEDTDYRLHFIYMSPDGVLIELHFRLHNNPEILPVDVDDILADSVPVRLGSVDMPAMSDELQFVFLATHGARHEWVRLQWVCDIAVMVDRATTEEVRQWLATAARFGLANPVAQALVIARHLLGIELPPEVSRAYAGSWRIRYMVRRAECLLLKSADSKTDGPSPAFNPGRRLYRMCVSGRPSYLLAEVRDGLKALSARLAKPAPRLS